MPRWNIMRFVTEFRNQTGLEQIKNMQILFLGGIKAHLILQLMRQVLNSLQINL